LLANAVSQVTDALRPGLHAVVGARLPAATNAPWEDRLSRASALLQQIAAVGFKIGGGRGAFCIRRPKKSPREEGFLFSSQREVLLSAYSTTLGSHSEIAGI
jgi:hypothetical protein